MRSNILALLVVNMSFVLLGPSRASAARPLGLLTLEMVRVPIVDKFQMFRHQMR